MSEELIEAAEEQEVSTTEQNNSEVESDNSDVLGMSDEDFLNASEEELAGVTEQTQDENNDDVDEDTLGDDEGQSDEDESANDTDNPDNAEDGESEESDESDDDDKKQPTSESNGKMTMEELQAFYDDIMSPIKASGREVKMKDSKHVKANIQMGVDYYNKMHGFKMYKPYMKALKDAGIIENPNGIDDFNFLMELKAGKPEAIKRLIAETGFDVDDFQDEDKFNPEESKRYRPSNVLASEAQIELEEALESIKDSPSYDKTIDILSNKFDKDSVALISDNPQYIGLLNADVESGLYDEVMSNVDYARQTGTIGRNVSDIDAYVTVVKSMAEEEAKNLETQNSKPNKNNSNKKGNNGKKVIKREVVKDTKRKRVAMSNSKTVSSKSNKQIPNDPLEMSDEEFMKLDLVSRL